MAEKSGNINYESIFVQSIFLVTLTHKRRCEKNSIVGTFCAEIPLQVSFPCVKTDRRYEIIALVSIELKGNFTSASVLEEQRVTLVYDLR